MKPPWKFLTDLVSRKKPADVADSSAHQSGKLIEIEARPVAALQLNAPDVDAKAPDDEYAAAAASEPDGSEEIADESRDGGAPLETAPEAPQPIVAPEDENQPEEIRMEEAVSIPRQRESRPARSARRPKVAGSDAAPEAAPSETGPAVPVPTKASPLLDEAASLDQEIKQLRDQLATKLRLQNEQLRKMLARYERS